MPMGTTRRAAPRPAAPQILVMPIKGTRGVVPPHTPGCLKPCKGSCGPSAAGKDAQFKRVMTLHLQTQGLNEMILEFSFDASQGLFEPHIARHWEPLLRSSLCLNQISKKKKTLKKIAFTSKQDFSLMLSPKAFCRGK